jgi:hypothetical protein
MVGIDRATMAVLAGLILSGCASSNDPQSPNYDPTFVAIGQTLSRPDTLPPADFVAQGARRGSEFPTFSRMPRGATSQISAAERTIIETEMAAALAEQRNDRAAADRYRARVAELQAIARNHGSETRAQIEN